ncbi:MAG TPA: hypothetical protein VK666_04915 [Chryseolinea sp.]|nr:hypothetical protein [Chryseolinea sp.]
MSQQRWLMTWLTHNNANSTNRMIVKILGAVLIAAILLIGCDSKKTTEQKAIVNPDSVNSIGQNSEPTDSATTEDDPEDADCIRGQATPVIKRTFYPNSTFNLNKDNITGIETVHFANGDNLTINNWGCEYFVLTFKFETTRFHADTTDINYWLDKAVILMTELEDALDAPLDTFGGTLATKNFMKGNKGYELGQEIVYDTAAIRDFVTIDRIQQLGEKRYAIEISYATGPL